MVFESFEQSPIALCGEQSLSDGLVKFRRVCCGKVGQLSILQPGPEILDRVEVWTVRRQTEDTQAREFTQQFADRFSFVHGTAVPEDDDIPGYLAHKCADEI